MYTSKKSVQILVALLKEHGISHLVLSSGTRNVPLVYSVENDPFFTCYSVVDERSAAFFALGIAQQLNRPVAISCTSSTATANYLSAITEAFYQKIPLLVLTGDRDPYMLGQLEDQQIKQFGMYADVIKKQVNLPVVRNADDAWYCERLINEALLELDHHGKGPVHINVPLISHEKSFSVPALPPVRAIRRYYPGRRDPAIADKVRELKSAKRILVITGQRWDADGEEARQAEAFAAKYNCVFATDHMSNLPIPAALKLYVVAETLSMQKFAELAPDIVITFAGNFLTNGFKAKFRNLKVRHWLVNEDGGIVDVFKSLSDIFESTPTEFFRFFAEQASEANGNDMDYYRIWKQQVEALTLPEMPYSAYTVIQAFAAKLPDDCLLHLSILNSTRICNYFQIPDSVKVYSNLGAYGIDGTLSTFFGQSVSTDKLAFLVIGDLSFLYDMNSARIGHIKNNVRILLVNNGGGCEFYMNTGKKNSPQLDRHTAARHHASGRGWIESLGFTYLSASSQEEYEAKLDGLLVKEANAPIVLEVFTDIQTDCDVIHAAFKVMTVSQADASVKTRLKSALKDIIGEDGVKKIRRLRGLPDVADFNADV